MGYQSTRSADFLSTVQRWIDEHGEVLVLLRFHASAGSKSWELFDSLSALQKRIEDLPPQTCLIVFRENELRFKGIVDDAFVKHVVRHHPKGEWWLVACLERVTMGRVSWYHSNEYDNPEELEEELRDEFCFGKLVAVGKEPEWIDSRDGLVDAVVPFEDGTVKTGVY